MNNFCQDTQTLQNHRKKCVTVFKLKAIQKDITKCDSLRKRYFRQHDTILKYSNLILKVSEEKDSIRELTYKIREDYHKVDKELTKEKAKKPSLIEQLIIVIIVFVAGGLTF